MIALSDCSSRVTHQAAPHCPAASCVILHGYVPASCISGFQLISGSRTRPGTADLPPVTRLNIAHRVIGEALQRKGDPDAHPSDYLNFYAIANRQKGSDPHLKHNSGAEKAGAKPDKSFIHVHAKVQSYFRCIGEIWVI